MKFEMRAPEPVEIGGKAYQVRKPTVGDLENMLAEEAKVTDSTQKVAYIRGWLAKLGLPPEATAMLYMDQLLELMEELTGTKKK
jgi:hypothetical protein